MKEILSAYYPPTPAEYERLWKDATIVLDTNVLLNLYRLPTSAREEFLNTLGLLKPRLWIPHQVALEFQRNRLTVIAAERRSIEEALASSQSALTDLRNKVDGLQIEKRGLGIDTKPLLEALANAHDGIRAAIEKAHKAQLDIASGDPLRGQLDELFAGRVGPGPASESDLADLVKDGEERFSNLIPPGFADTDKDKNPANATFIHEHLKYHRRFGDLILWRQLIVHAKSYPVKSVLLVTADRKDDWWWREQGKTIGPHPELVSEIRREAGVELFWMYSSVQFLEHANQYIAASVSTEAVEELQQVVVSPVPKRQASTRNDAPRGFADTEPASSQFSSADRTAFRRAGASIQAWLSEQFGTVIANIRGFPDFLVREGDDTHGYEVKYLRRFDRMLFPPGIINSVLRGHLEVAEGRLSKFSIVILIPEADFFNILADDRVGELKRALSRLLKRYPITGIIAGAMIDNAFEVLLWQQRDPLPNDDEGEP